MPITIQRVALRYVTVGRRCYNWRYDILRRMENKLLLTATVRFFAGFCVNVAAAYFLATFVAQNTMELTTRMALCILYSYMTISLEVLMQRL